MKTKNFTIPQLEPFQFDINQIDIILNEMKQAKASMTFYLNPDGTCNFLFTGFEEKEFSMLMILMSRHSQVFDFFKSVIVNTELYGENEEEALKYTTTLLRYMNNPK